ncbi:MAG: hypothetical protein CMK02_11400 [Polycyclovorans sp.]|jgi:uncharacterized protein (TIGR02001 family)|nr:hypothetical protein [Polycyclovorans sp.]|tara:strand:+ start:4534 stop:5262 length:729 start_codon:yes stop_codon:yes gene_type:complete
MNFKHLAVAAAVSSATFSGAALAQLSGNVGLTSEYFFRGLAQSGGSAVSGGLDYAAESGFYVGTWASTINFASAEGSGTEVDLYAGFGGEAGSVGYDIGAIYYWYSEEGEAGADPDPSNNTFELYGSLGFGPVTLGVAYSLSDYFALTDESVLYTYLGLSLPISEMLSFDAHVGFTSFDDPVALNPTGDPGAPATIDEYLDYSIGISASLESGFSPAFSFVGTDLDGDDLQAVVSVGYEFGL